MDQLNDAGFRSLVISIRQIWTNRLLSGLRLPVSWRTNSKTCVTQVEARFQMRHIRSEQHNYLQVVAALIVKITDAVDVFAAEPQADIYDHFKNRKPNPL